MTADLSRTDRTRLRRSHERGHFDRETLYGILDAMPLCHVGYNIDGKPVVMPTCQWRQGDHVYWHGSSASRGLRAAEKMDVCLTVTLMDGLVLARSGMHHSANFRSAMIYGVARKIEDTDEKVASLLTRPPPKSAPAAQKTTRKTTPSPSGLASSPSP